MEEEKEGDNTEDSIMITIKRDALHPAVVHVYENGIWVVSGMLEDMMF